jgi:CheY-like chemotaxis protein
MSEKFMIIANKPISSAIVSTLSLLNSYNFVQINPLQFSDLETLVDDLGKFKDVEDINAIIISDFLSFNEKYPINDLFGIELIKHIRLTGSLGSLCLLPIILLSSKEIMLHLKSNRDNIILASPGCYPIYIPFFISELFNTINELKRFESQEEMRNVLNDYIVWSKDDDVTSEHDNFNRYGPFKLLEEYCANGEVPEVMTKEYRVMTRRLWFKKYKFLRSSGTRTISDEAIEGDTIKNEVRGKKILYIDDEHRSGWSFVIYSIISGNHGKDIYEAFQDRKCHIIESPDGKLTCIDSYDEAFNLFVDYEKRFTGALSSYSEVEDRKTVFSEQYTGIQEGFSGTERRFKTAAEDLSRIEKGMQATEKMLREIHATLKGCMDTFADAYTLSTDDIEPEVIEPQLRALTDAHRQYKETLDKFLKYKDDHKRSRELYDKQKEELERQSLSLQEIKSEKEKASGDYEHAIKLLARDELFPYDLVILDLRLEKAEDGQVPPQELSGIMLLRQIKETHPGIPVIIFTASQKAINYKEAIDKGASGYWIKVINTYSDLKNGLIRSLANAGQIRDLWTDIKMVEAKKQLNCRRENPSTQRLEKAVMDVKKKADIIRLLKESFLMLQGEKNRYEESICDYGNYSRIALNMGLIQEERFVNILDNWKKWQTKNKIDGTEKTIRQIRNSVAHKLGQAVTKEDAVKVFRFTLDKCLRN